MTREKTFQVAQRVQELPPYLFARIDKMKQEVKARGVDVISLGIGDPDQPTLLSVVEAMGKAIHDPNNHQYPAYEGSLAFRQSCAVYLKKRLGISLDPDKEILALIGSKEGIGHLPFAFVDPGDITLVPDPGYPVYATATRFAGGEPYLMPLREDNAFLPDLKRIPVSVWKRAKILFLNYPNNPTGAKANRAFFEQALDLASRYGVLVAHDAAYFEVYTGKERPLSILEIDGARDWAIEFHSHSKTYNMTGWRIGFAAGSPKAIDALGRIKNNLDSGAFTAIQDAAAIANLLPESERNKVRRVYAERRKLALSLLRKAGFQVFDQGATFYLWVRVPQGMTSADFAMKALDQAGVVITPGNGFGQYGEGYFRVTLCAETERLREALTRLASLS